MPRDDQTPEEWDDAAEPSEADWAWAVSASSFGGDADARTEFVVARARFLRAAEAAGVPREAFLPFRPNEPGFMDRAREAFTALPRAMGWAAE